MARIKILDLPRDMKITQDEMRKVMGGIDTVPLPDRPVIYSRWFPLADPRPTPAGSRFAKK